MGQKHESFSRDFWTTYPLRDILKNPRSIRHVCAAGDGTICSKNGKTVPNTRNGARLRFPSPIMVPDPIYKHELSILVTFWGKSELIRRKNGTLR